MTTKDQLRARTLMDRGMKRVKDPETGRFSVVDSAVDKTPLMLYTEGVTGQTIESILLKQMSTRRLAEWLSQEIARQVSYGTLMNWRKQFGIRRIRRGA